MSENSISFKKISFMAPIYIWEQIRGSNHFKDDFDLWICRLIYDRLVAEGYIVPEKKPNGGGKG